MQLAWFDLATFVAFFVFVIGISRYKSREEKGASDYFLAGRSLGFWLIGFSLIAAKIALVGNVLLYGLLLWMLPDVAFLNHMAITFLTLIGMMGLVTWLRPLPQAVNMPVRAEIELESAPAMKLAAGVLLAITVLLYVIFW